MLRVVATSSRISFGEDETLILGRRKRLKRKALDAQKVKKNTWGNSISSLVYSPLLFPEIGKEN